MECNSSGAQLGAMLRPHESQQLKNAAPAASAPQNKAALHASLLGHGDDFDDSIFRVSFSILAHRLRVPSREWSLLVVYARIVWLVMQSEGYKGEFDLADDAMAGLEQEHGCAPPPHGQGLLPSVHC